MPNAPDLDQVHPKAELATTEQINAQMLLQADAAFQENVNYQTEIRATRLSICQGTTKEITSGIDGYSLGQIISSTTREILSTKAPPPWLIAKGVASPAPVHFLPVIPVMKLPTEYLEPYPRDELKEGQQWFKWKTLNPRDERVIAGTYRRQGGTFDPGPNNNPPPVLTCMNYFFLPVDLIAKNIKEGFAIGSFSKTSMPAGSMLSTLIQNRRAQKIFAWDSVYFLYTTPKTMKKGTTQVYNVVWGGLVKELCPDVQSMAQAMAVQLSHPETGRQLQEAILNATEISEDNDESHTADSSSSTSDFASTTKEADDAFGDGSKQGF